MSAPDPSQCESIDRLAEEFVQRYRLGERPSLKEYLDKYPELADDIRTLFPALVEIERIKEDQDDAGAIVEAPPLRQVGDYRIVREVGHGGMGVVYEAEQVSLGRRVALKVLPAHTASDRQALERFRREAKSAAKLHHTNIVPVFEVGRDGAACYYAMQFIQGQSLDQIIAELDRLRGAVSRSGTDVSRPVVNRLAQSLLTGCFQVDQAAAAADETETHVAAPEALHVVRSSRSADAVPLVDSPSSAVLPGQTDLSSVQTDRPHYFQSVARIGYQTAAALAYAHARGVIHRDIKPSNLLLDSAGVVWITDFGLAKTQDAALTTTGDIVGTLRYMAPERLKGEGDERGDVYALGLTLYEMLVLRPAFAGRDRLQLIDCIKNQEPIRPRALDRRIPRDLETIVLKAMEKEAKQRYPSAETMAEDLRRFLADEPIQARRTSRLGRLRLWGRRNPAVASLLGLVFLLLVCLTVGSLAAAFWLNHKNLDLAAAEEDRTEKLYQSLVAQASASRYSRQVGQRLDTLEAVRKAAELVRERHMPAERLDELRNLAIAALVLPDFQTLRTWEGFPGGSNCWGADDQLRRYARGDADGNISLRWIDTNEEIARLDGWKHDFWLYFSPGGRFLRASDHSQFRLWDLSATQPQLVQGGADHGFVFHPDGRHALVRRGNDSMALHDLADSQQKPLVLIARSSPHAFDPAGNRLAAIETGKVYILDAKAGNVLSFIPEPDPQSAEIVSWHPNGNYLALVCSRNEIHVWDLKGIKRISVVKGCRSSVTDIAFTPDGELLLTSGWEGKVRVWDWRTGRQVLQQSGGSQLRFRADGRLVICEGSRLHLVELTTAREYRSIVQQSNAGEDVSYWPASIHSGSRLVAVAMSDRTRLFDLDSGEELGSLPEIGHGPTFQGKEALLTNGSAGLLRWPIRVDEANPSRWRLGPPKQLADGTIHGLSCDKTGSVIGQPARAKRGAFVVRPGKSKTYLGPHANARGIAISPDGKYAATNNHHGDEGVKVWDTQTGKLLVHFPLGGQTGAEFSPDGEWLVAQGSRGRRLVKVGTWEQRPLAAGGIFSPDGAFLAAGENAGVIRLLEPATNRELARLADPNQFVPGPLTFTPDGGKLLVGSEDALALHVWDLRAIRTQLAKMGLDWDSPPLPEADHPKNPLPLEITVDLGGMVPEEPPEQAIIKYSLALAVLPNNPVAYRRRGHAHYRLRQWRQAADDLGLALALDPDSNDTWAWLELGSACLGCSRPKEALAAYSRIMELGDADAAVYNSRSVACYCLDLWDKAIADVSKALELQPSFPTAQNNLAWLLATCPQAKLHNPVRAVALAKQAVASLPKEGGIWTTLGVAHYRAGEWIDARKALEKSLEVGQATGNIFWFGRTRLFLAMSHWRLGDQEKGRTYYQQAVEWIGKNQRELEKDQGRWSELHRFRAEAESVLAQLPGQAKK